MNTFGSYRTLRDNAISAMIAAIEVYNKPRMEYRSECFVILLINAWELILKAILSKNKKRIFYRKERNKPYVTLSVFDALKGVKRHFPKNVPFKPVAENIERLVEYRNNAMHFYNEKGFDVLIYGLAQTSIINFRDIVSDIFLRDIADEVNLSLLPLSFGTPPDPIHFLKKGSKSKNKSVAEYIKLISDTTRELESENIDTGRFLTVFTVNLQSTKKITTADVVAGISGDTDVGSRIVTRRIDPNKSHPMLRMNVLDEIGHSLNGVKFTSNTFEAIAWSEKLKENPRYYWKPDKGGSSHYSHEIIQFLKRLTKSHIEKCIKKYRNRPKKKK